jgi:hypothetical protein
MSNQILMWKTRSIRILAVSEAEIVLRFAAYKLHSETGAVMVGSLNDRNIGLLRIEEI